MKKEFQSIVRNDLEQIDLSSDKTIFMGGTLIALNLILMLLVGLYWMNPEMHQYISGRPLL